MCFELNSISKRSKKPIYCIQYRSRHGVTIAEMVMKNNNDKTFYLSCPAKRYTTMSRPLCKDSNE